MDVSDVWNLVNALERLHRRFEVECAKAILACESLTGMVEMSEYSRYHSIERELKWKMQKIEDEIDALTEIAKSNGWWKDGPSEINNQETTI